MKYTIKAVQPTGKSDPKYGNEYMVQFNEDMRTVKMSRQQPPVVGAEEQGEIKENAYGAYFKKDSNFQGGFKGGARKDNSDGMRQGMCINNAAAYVASVAPEPQAPEAWADAVFKYATALYRKGDLTQTEEDVVVNDIPETNQEIQQQVESVFG